MNEKKEVGNIDWCFVSRDNSCFKNCNFFQKTKKSGGDNYKLCYNILCCSIYMLHEVYLYY